LFSTIHGLVALTEESSLKDIYSTLKYFQINFKFDNWKSEMNSEVFLSTAYSNLYSAAARISHNEIAFLQTYNMIKKNLTTNKKVLIVTATSTEAKTVLQRLETKGKTPNPISVEKVTLWNFGVLGNCELNMLKLSEMGSSKPSGSALVIYDAIKLIRPDYVIMVGIAFGLKRKKQKIGDILVSRELQDYDSTKKTEEGTIQRGHKIPAGSTLLERFDNSALRFNGADVELGFIISGDTLADSKPFVDELIASFPEAIGGEMEGTGLQSSCHRDNTEWILIKGICDWGYDKQHADKEHDQKTAINNVCDYLIYTLSNFEL
jgi:nucleoside phosphorylase